MAPQLHVSGNSLVDRQGRQVVLHGVDRSGGEYACVQGWGIWDGPMNGASVAAMKTWHVNAVRVPLNEACWNGGGYVKPQFRGPAYRNAVVAYVRLLNRNGIVAVLDLHWTDGAYTGPSSGCRSFEAVCQKPMPDAAQSVRFWNSVARTFRGNNAVIFDLFNEPYPERAAGGSVAAGWRCWLHGGSSCTVLARVPLVVGEMGENDCAGGYIGPLMRWLDARKASYLGWTWNADFPCGSGPSLITSYAGTPTGFGASYRAHLRGLK